MKIIVLIIGLMTSQAFAATWATNDKNDPAGTNAMFKALAKPKLEKHESHCFNQIKKIRFLGTSYDVKIVAKKKMSDSETISYYEVREFKKANGFKQLVKKQMYSCMHGLNSFDNNKPHKRKLMKVNRLPKGVKRM